MSLLMLSIVLFKKNSTYSTAKNDDSISMIRGAKAIKCNKRPLNSECIFIGKNASSFDLMIESARQGILRQFRVHTSNKRSERIFWRVKYLPFVSVSLVSKGKFINSKN